MPKGVSFSEPLLPSLLVRHHAVLRDYLNEWLEQQERLLHDALSTSEAQSNAAVQFPKAGGDAVDFEDRQPIEGQGPPPIVVGSATPAPAHLPMATPKTSVGTLMTQKSYKSYTTIRTRAKSFMSKGTLDRGMQVLGFRKSRFEQHEGRLEKAERKAESIIDNAGADMPVCVLLGRVFHSWAFESLCQIVILANTITLAASTQYFIDHPEHETHSVFDGFELGFCCFYTMEILLRMIVLRVEFFIGHEMGWNWFELILVVTSLQEQLGSGMNLSYTRTLRMFKVLKVLRIVRLMRIFRELRLILDSLMGSVKSVLWSIVLIVAINFMFGMCFVRAVTFALVDPVVSDDAKASMRLYWGSLTKSVHSLYQATTGGDDWGAIAAPLWDAGEVYYLIFCFYVGIFLFVIMNSLTSLFVDSVMQYSDADEDELIEEKLSRKAEYMKKLVSLFNQLDDDGSGEITLEEFREHLADPRMEAFGASMEVESYDLERLFIVLTADGRRPVDLETFVVGCIRMKGGAKSIDMQGLLLSQKKSAQDQHRIAALCSQHLQSLRQIEQQVEQQRAALAARAKDSQPPAEESREAAQPLVKIDDNRTAARAWRSDPSQTAEDPKRSVRFSLESALPPPKRSLCMKALDEGGAAPDISTGPSACAAEEALEVQLPDSVNRLAPLEWETSSPIEASGNVELRRVELQTARHEPLDVSRCTCPKIWM